MTTRVRPQPLRTATPLQTAPTARPIPAPADIVPVRLAPTDPSTPRRLRRAPGTQLACGNLAPVEQWAGSLVVAAAEVLSGCRPVQQLTRWLDRDVYATLARRAGLRARLHGRPSAITHARLLAIRASDGPDSVHEVTAVVHDGAQVRAVALRVERWGSRWRASALEIG